MALARSFLKGVQLKNVQIFSKTVPVSVTSMKSMAYWNKDWAPGPYPKNEEEKKAAAKKYGLLPEDYEPYPDAGEGYGDYPKLPEVSTEGKDPNYLWDIKHLRRNFGEPMHVDADVLIDERMTPDAYFPYSKPFTIFTFFAVIGSVVLFFALSPERDRVKLMKPRQMYTPGVTHYTFQLEGQEDEGEGGHH